MKRITLYIVVFGFLAGLVSAQGKSKPVLPEKYKKWLNEEVVYIITPREKDVFRRLETDRERDIFIEAFWKHRDPTPGTPQNEFKEEHYKRLAYANEYFGRGTMRPGWMTDRGRIYIILGPPQNIEEYDTIQNVHPALVWFYLGDPAYGLPTGFHIIFFRKNGMGEYVLYSPVDDGPESLLTDWGTGLYQDATAVDSGTQTAYKQLLKLAPNLAYQTLSLIDGERVLVGTVSLASMKLIGDVASYPQKKVEDTYADALLKYKDVIDVDYTANYIASDAFLSVIKDPSGLFLVEYSVEPKRISVDSYGGKYGANFELDGRVSDAMGNTVYQYVKEFPLSFSSAELEDLRSKSLAIQDLFPLVPGSYKFNLLLKNTVSKEFTSFEGSIDIPEATGGAPVISALVLGYQLDKGASADRDFVPFKTAAGQLICQARKTFSRKDNLYVFFQVFGLSPELRSQGKINVTVLKQDAEFLTRSKGMNEYGPGPDFLEEFALANFPPDYYNVKISFVDGSGKELLASDENFEVSMAANLPRPLIVSKVMPASRVEEYDYILGLQMLSLGRPKEAYASLEKAYRKNPGQLKYALGFCQVLFELNEFQKVKDVLVPFSGGEQGLDQVYYLLGKSAFGLGQYAEALPYFKDYLTRFGANLEVLNLLGMTYYKLGDTAEALAAWRKSLEISPNQEDIKKLVDSLPKK